MIYKTRQNKDSFSKELFKNSERKDLMNIEWQRFISFEKFPGQVSGLRLAQNGFYYSGINEEVTCFCCGLTNDHWPQNETLSETHRRLSPHCKFVMDVDDANVSISNKESGRHAPRNGSESSVAVSGACGGPDDLTDIEPNTKGKNDNGNRQVAVSETAGHERSLTSREEASPADEKERERHLSGVTESQPPLVNQTSTPSYLDRAKYPDYLTTEKRQESFIGWPQSYVTPRPESFAEAGLFFTGNYTGMLWRRQQL